MSKSQLITVVWTFYVWDLNKVKKNKLRKGIIKWIQTKKQECM